MFWSEIMRSEDMGLISGTYPKAKIKLPGIAGEEKK